MRKRIYLADPMRGHADFNFPAFDAAAAELRQDGHEVFNPAELPPDYSLRECFAADTQYISMSADTIALLPGWENSWGARSEYALAKALGLMVLYL